MQVPLRLCFCGVTAFALATSVVVYSGAIPAYQEAITLRRIFENGGQVVQRVDNEITAIDLSDGELTPQFLETVRQLPRLEAITLGGMRVTDETLAQLGGFPRLRLVVLDSTLVSNDACEAFQNRWPEVTLVRSEKKAIAALCRCENVWVDSKPRSTPQVVSAYFGSRNEEEAVQLRVLGSFREDERYLTVLRNLTDLELVDSGISKDTVVSIVTGSQPNLRSLTLYMERPCDDVLRDITFRGMEELQIGGTGDLSLVASRPFVASLQMLVADSDFVSQDQLRSFQNTVPHCRVLLLPSERSIGLQ